MDAIRLILSVNSCCLSIGCSRESLQLCHHQHLWDSCRREDGGRHVQSSCEGNIFPFPILRWRVHIAAGPHWFNCPLLCFQCHPAESLRLFVPHCCNAITHLTASTYKNMTVRVISNPCQHPHLRFGVFQMRMFRMRKNWIKNCSGTFSCCLRSK